MTLDDDNIWVPFSVEEIIEQGLEDELEVASHEIHYLENAGIFDKGPTWTKLWYQYELSWLDREKCLVNIPEEVGDRLVEAAQETPEGFDILVLLAKAFSNDCSALPPSLSLFLAKLLDAEVSRPKKVGRPPDADKWVRDIMIHHTANTLKSRFGHETSTRNAATNKAALSDVIYHAIRSQHGENLNLGSVQNTLNNKALSTAVGDIRHLYFMSMLDDLD